MSGGSFHSLNQHRWVTKYMLAVPGRHVICIAVLLSLLVVSPASGQMSDARPGHVPTLAPLVREVTPAVVNISVHGKVRQDNPLYKDPFFREFFDVPKQLEQEVSAAGSGVIVDAQRGIVLTANHVVDKISTAQITTKDGRKFAAKVVGRDPATDIAVLRMQGSTEHLKALPMGNSDQLEVGDYVIAVGNPFGLGQTVTSGIVSAMGRTGLGKQGYEDFIQTDAPINPGNSGGGLIDLKGELVGINTAILSPGGGNIGIGFAVPINMARQVMQQIVQTGRVQRGRIGVSIQDPQVSGTAGEGALIAEVSPSSPADVAGIRKGDLVVKADGVPVRSAAQLRNKVGLTPVGKTVQLTVRRDGSLQNVDVTIAPTESGQHAAGRRP